MTLSDRSFEFSEVASSFQQKAGDSTRRPLLSRHRRLRDRFESLFDTRKTYVDVSREIGSHAFSFVDVFSGAGGLSSGFRTAGFKKILSVEIDADASATIRRNFPDSEHFEGAIETFSDSDLRQRLQSSGQIDVLCGGPPCQGFSVAGARDPNDPRNFLFHQFVRFARIIQPRYVVLENVPGILTMKNGTVQESIRQAFLDIGFPEMSVTILEAAEYGIPQLRPRAIFVANRLGMSNPYPAPILKEANFVPIEHAIMDLADRPPDPSINHEWTRHSKEVEERISKVAPGASLYASYFDAFKRQYAGKPSMTVKENHGGTHIHPHRNRVLSAREMARLQSFPDDFIFSGTMKRVMWQVGNAVPPRLGEVIASAIATELIRIDLCPMERNRIV
jgi:DNA (cytosine-5)-methyltransferase 1